jgi:hypothetical protein
MARRGPAANLREQAIELLAQGDKPPEVAVALGITEEALRDWRRKPAFTNAVLARSRQLLKLAMPFLYARMMEQAEAGHAGAQRLILTHLETLEKMEAEKTSEEWKVTWSSADAAPTAPPEPVKEDE